jgi:hypothetical protein
MVFVSVIYAHLPEFLMSPGRPNDRMRLWRIKVEQIVAKIKGRHCCNANGGRTLRGKNQSKMLNSNDLKYTKEI